MLHPLLNVKTHFEALSSLGLNSISIWNAASRGDRKDFVFLWWKNPYFGPRSRRRLQIQSDLPNKGKGPKIKSAFMWKIYIYKWCFSTLVFLAIFMLFPVYISYVCIRYVYIKFIEPIILCLCCAYSFIAFKVINKSVYEAFILSSWESFKFYL